MSGIKYKKSIKEITDFLGFLGDAILMTNESSEIIFANTACAKLFLYKKDEIVKLRIDDLMKNSESINHPELVTEFINSDLPPKGMMTRDTIPCINSKGEPLKVKISIAHVVLNKKNYGIATIEDYTPIFEEMSKLESTSNVDELTNLYNRHYLQEVLKAKSRILLKWNAIGVMYLDLDKFKPVNDNYGHKAGDEILKLVSKRLKESVRYDDILFRVGGDEFLIFLNLSDIPDKLRIMKNISYKIRDKISESIVVEKKHSNIGVSIGAGIYPDNNDDLTELIDYADKAMYQSKSNNSLITFVNQLPKAH